MKKHKNLFLSLVFLAITIFSSLTFLGIFSSDMDLFLGFSLFPLAITLTLGFFIPWILERFGKRPNTSFWVFIITLIATAIITFSGFYDLAFSKESFFPGLFGIILFIFSLPPVAVTMIASLIITAMGQSKRRMKEFEDKNV